MSYDPLIDRKHLVCQKYLGERIPNIALRRSLFSVTFLSKEDAQEIFDRQREAIEANWEMVCDDAKLSEVDRNSHSPLGARN